MSLALVMAGIRAPAPASLASPYNHVFKLQVGLHLLANPYSTPQPLLALSVPFGSGNRGSRITYTFAPKPFMGAVELGHGVGDASPSAAPYYGPVGGRHQFSARLGPFCAMTEKCSMLSLMDTK